MDDFTLTVDDIIQDPEAEVGYMKVVKKIALKAGLLSLKVVLLSFWMSAIWAFGDLAFEASEEKSHGYLWNAYALVSLICFEMGMVLLLLSMLLPQLPRIFVVTKKLVWVAFVLVQIAIGFKMSAHVMY